MCFKHVNSSRWPSPGLQLLTGIPVTGLAVKESKIGEPWATSRCTRGNDRETLHYTALAGDTGDWTVHNFLVVHCPLVRSAGTWHRRCAWYHWRRGTGAYQSHKLLETRMDHRSAASLHHVCRAPDEVDIVLPCGSRLLFRDEFISLRKSERPSLFEAVHSGTAE